MRRLFGGRTGIDFKLGTNVVALLCPNGIDPSPGEIKALRVRCEMTRMTRRHDHTITNVDTIRTAEDRNDPF